MTQVCRLSGAGIAIVKDAARRGRTLTAAQTHAATWAIDLMGRIVWFTTAWQWMAQQLLQTFAHVRKIQLETFACFATLNPWGQMQNRDHEPIPVIGSMPR
jgi:hypothetical protein